MILIEGRAHDLGGGMLVRRVLPFAQRRRVGPFVFLDHMGPVEIAADQNTDVRPHPHIGLSTLTYLFEGRINHHDSLDQRATILPGEVNWMTAGRGIAHSERTHPDDAGRARRLHGLQFWVALPDGQEEIAPFFRHYADVPHTPFAGYTLRVVAGTGFGLKSPVEVTSPLIFAECKVTVANEIPVSGLESFETAVYVIAGSVEANGTTVNALQMLAFDRGELNALRAPPGAHFVVIGGEPLASDRIIWWNLVSSSRERIEQTKRAWAEGTFPMVPGETEFIPLPTS